MAKAEGEEGPRAKGEVARSARRAPVRISRARAGPAILGLQPGARWRVTISPCSSTSMSSVLVPPPSTPIL